MPKDSKKLAAELPKKIRNHQAFMKQLGATFESMRDAKYAKQNIKFFPVPESPLGPNYGVRIPKIRSIARPVAKEGVKDLSNFFNLLDEIWGHGYAEDRFFVCHSLNVTAEEDAERTLETILRISSGIRNWALCDTLATEALGPITVSKPKRVIPIAKGFMQSNMKWLRKKFLYFSCATNRQTIFF